MAAARHRLLGALLFVLLLATAARADSPYNWPRLPTDDEIASAKAAFQSSLQGKILYVQDAKFHREVSIDGAMTLIPLDCDGVYLKYAVATGGEAISVNGQVVGTSAQRELHRLTYLRFDPAKDEFFFGTPRGGGSSALAAIAAAAEAYPAPTADDLNKRLADMHKETTQDLGNGHVTKSRLVDGWCAGSVAGSSSPTWVIAVGGVGAVAAAAAALATAAALIKRNQSKTPGAKTPDPKNEDPHQTIGYVLQLSSKSLVLEPDNPATLTAKAWRVNAQGGYAPAPDAAILLTLPAQAALRANPTNGRGTLKTTLSCKLPLPGIQVLTFTANADGKTVNETVEVKPSGDDMVLDMEAERESITAVDGPVVAYVIRADQKSGKWDFHDLVVWFTQPGSDKPVKPPFTPLFGKPTFEPALPGLTIGQPVTADGITWRFKLSLDPNVELDDQWLAKDGLLSVTVPCTEAPGRP